jgi:hypothetical protein
MVIPWGYLIQQQCDKRKYRKDVPLYVPDRNGSQWISLSVTRMKLGKNYFSSVTCMRSVDLYRRPWKDDVERVKGIEPSLSAWEAGVMPLYDTRSERLTLYQMCAWK